MYSRSSGFTNTSRTACCAALSSFGETTGCYCTFESPVGEVRAITHRAAMPRARRAASVSRTDPTSAVCRLCRREGIKLYLKGSRCDSPKCAIDRRNVPPGMHGYRRGKPSEYGMRLREKQKL